MLPASAQSIPANARYVMSHFRTLPSGQLALKYKRTNRFTGLPLTAESATTLPNWTPIAPISATLMTDGTELIETRLPAGSSGFLRLRATQTP